MNARTVIGSGTKVTGELKTAGDVIVLGYFEGRAESAGDTLIQNGGMFNGDAICRNLTVKGLAQGSAVCSDTMTVAPEGSYKGNIKTNNLCTDKGSILSGTICMEK